MGTRSNRRKFVGKGIAAAAAAVAAAAPSSGQQKLAKKVHRPAGAKPPAEPPLFSSVVSYGNLVFLAGVVAHSKGDVREQTKTVLDQIQKNLELAGSSMEKVLKCNVYLNDLKDYQAMNEVYLGRFGAEPPARTTVAVAGGIPLDSLVEIDVVAYI